MKKWLFVQFVACLLGAFAEARAQPVAIHPGQSEVNLANVLQVFEDPSGRLGAEEASARAARGEFKPGSGRLGARRTVWWLRVAVANGTSASQWHLDTGSRTVHRVQVHWASASGHRGHREAGSHQPFGDRPVRSTTYVLPVEVRPGETTEILLRIESSGWMPVALSPMLLTPERSAARAAAERSQWLAYAGLAVALGLFNLLLFFSLRDWNYLLYVGALVTTAWSVSSSYGGFGAAYEFLWPDSPRFEQFSWLGTLLVAAIAATAFFARLIRMDLAAPRLYALVLWLLAGYAVLTIPRMLAPFVEIPAFVLRVTSAAGPAAYLLWLGVANWAVYGEALRGNRQARYAVVAWLPLIGAVIHLGVQNMLRSRPALAPVMWASAFEMVMMALALADRFNEERKAKQAAQAQLVETLQASEKVLEAKVEERTRELKASYEVVEAQRAELSKWNTELEERVQSGVKEIERLSHLKRFFSPAVSSLILAGEVDPLKTRRKEITVVFLDLRGFTAFSDSAAPEEVMTVLREYHDTMGRLVVKHNGTVEHFAGDGIMIFFNDPIELPDAELQAVQMAVEMQQAFAECEKRWRTLGHKLGMGIGIAQGYATIGAIGFEGRLDYGAVGSVCNLAARICSESSAGQILVQERVIAKLDGRFVTQPVEERSLKGVSRPVAVLNVLAAGPARALRAGLPG